MLNNTSLHSIPLCVCWCAYLYMPAMLYIYVTNMHLPPIKYCQPYLMTATGIFCTFYCILAPLVYIVGADWPAPVAIVCGYILPCLICVSFILSAGAVVVMYKITDLIVLHSHFSPAQVKRLSFYRKLLYPKVQVVAVAACGAMVSAPYSIAVYSFRGLTTAELLHSSHDTVLWAATCTLALLAGIGGIVLSAQMAPYIDNLGLRFTYRRSCYAGSILVALSAMLSTLEITTSLVWARNYNVHYIFYTLAAQYFFFFNLVVPLRQLASFQRLLFGRYVASTRAASSSASQSRKATVPAAQTDELEQYLHSPHGTASFFEFCQRDFRTEEIRAWQLVEQFKHGNVTEHKVLSTCLLPQCPLACPTSIEWGPLYVKRVNSWMHRDTDIVGTDLPRTFFDEFQVALLSALCEDVWLRFKEQSMEWKDHNRRRKSLEGMDTVLRMVVKQAPPEVVSPTPAADNDLLESLDDELASMVHH
ncbi:hypothetical protein H310_09793 [Aphanomyces invadans]|uniref:RGS domain-containing protein n=1 Tax=Aphanomyces invadans TaxID=157072 RepID=A0A024TTK5_9STRA|nr:hypothetical protein H310_09793 [Aphanomyces invadans]ETV96931.1 hypothetical protein H310_09793 [Aphanomyces invadans]|eukprot:XP_008874177.1 hypothetical protein H310_09793 [Aphanomyces invadans]